MPRYKAIIEYDGTFFNGFQKQKLTPQTVQGIIEEAIFKLTSETITICGSGRTDAGVHAKGQVIHFDLSKEWSLHNLKKGLNFYLKYVAILDVEEVDSMFHARFSAVQREYEYVILNRQAFPVLDKNRVWHIPKPLSLDKMQKAAKLFTGTHDFNAFRSHECRALKTERSIETFQIIPKDDQKITCHIKARAFLHNQVRIMVGTLVWYSLEKITKDDILIALQTGIKKNIGPTAPAHGLFFKNVTF